MSKCIHTKHHIVGLGGLPSAVAVARAQADAETSRMLREVVKNKTPDTLAMGVEILSNMTDLGEGHLRGGSARGGLCRTLWSAK